MQVPPPPPAFGGPAYVAPLPPGWTEHVAPTGHQYYYHAASGQSTYVRPAAAGSMPPPPPPGFAVAGPSSQPVEVASNSKPKKKKAKAAEKVPIPGTSWLRVTTNEGKVFYTNTETKSSVWTVPDEIAEQVRELETQQKQEQNGNAAAEAESREAERLLAIKEAEMQQLREELEREREASRKRKLQEEEEEQQRIQAQESASKKARLAAQVLDDDEEIEQAQEELQEEQEEEEELEDWQKDELRIKAELQAELETSDPQTKEELSSEEGIALYKTMLAEKDINPMRPWDMELPKFINDPRYKAVKSLRERRDFFDEHCKHKVREQRAKKAAAGQAKSDPATAYRALLVAEVTSTRTHWDDFRRKLKKDSRFRDYGRDDKEREKAFRTWLRELGEIKRADAQKAEEKFLAMLGEHKLPADARWSEVKASMASDPRYKAVASSSQREELFKKYLATPREDTKPVEDPEEAKRQAAEERKAKQAAWLREREETVRREREALDRAAGRTKAEAGREGAEREFKALLIDAVRDHDARWHDVQATLEQDRRFTSSSLRESEMRRMFDDHVNDIYDKRITAIEKLFAESATTLRTPFEDVYPQISSNPAVTRMHFSEDKLGRLYDEWNRRRYAQAQKDFEAMLSESTFIDYWGRLKQESASKDEERTKEILGAEADADEGMDAEDAVDLKTMAAQIDLKQLEAVLKHDKRFTVFDYDPETRERLIREHIEKLGRPKQTVHQH